MIVSRSIDIDYGHTLPNHYSFCNQLHGHRAKIIAEFTGRIIEESNNSSEGMIVDFKHLKTILVEEIHNVLDHGFAVWKDDTRMITVKKNPDMEISTLDFVKARNEKFLITDLPPTAEVLVEYFFGRVYEKVKKLFGPNVWLSELKWYETPNNYAEYTLNDMLSKINDKLYGPQGNQSSYSAGVQSI